MTLADILKGQEAEGKEKHVPVIEIGTGRGEGKADIVHVVVGKDVPHPNTVQHHIAWIQVFGVKEDGQVVDLGRSDFAASYTEPNIRLQAPVAGFKCFCALAYCNIHGVWQSCLDV